MKSWVTSIILAFSFFSSYSQDNWVPLGTTTNGITTYYRVKDLKYEGNIITTWLKQGYLPENIEKFRNHFINFRRRNNLSVIAFEKLAYALVRNSYDCRRNKMRTTRMVFYNADGQEITSEESNESQVEWLDIAPETISEFILEKFCRRQ